VTQDDCVSKCNKQPNTPSFFIFANKFFSFFVSIMSAEESFVEKLQRHSKERLQKLREEKQI
jgi:hypothetical protein